MKTARSLIAKTSFAAMLAGAVVAGHATTITLNTTLLEADSTLTLSQDALDALSITNTSVSPGGYARDLGPNSSGLSQYSLPITSLSVDVSLFPLSLTLPSAAQVNGSSLTFTDNNNGKAVTFANLSVNFKNDTIYGDFTSAAGTTKQLDLFNFTVTQPLKFSLTGGISLTEQMGNLAMTSDAVTAFQQGLSLPKAVTLLLPTINFGTIDAKIVPWIRSTPLKAVPEPSTYAILGVGLAAAGLTLRRRQSA